MRKSVLSLVVGVSLVASAVSACSSASTAASSPSPSAASTVAPSTPAAASAPGTSSAPAAPTAAPPATTTSVFATSSAGAAPAAGGSIDDGIGHPVKICALMPPATAAKISGIPVTVGEEQDIAGDKIYACNYTNASGTDGFTINVLAMDAAAGFDGNVAAAGSGSHPISGLGDKASSSVLGVEALFGSVSITVANLQSDSAAEALIRALQPKL